MDYLFRKVFISADSFRFMDKKFFNVILIVVGLFVFILASVLGATPGILGIGLSDVPAVILGLLGSMIFLFGLFNFSSWNIWIKIILSIAIPLLLLFLFVLFMSSGGGI